jgi:beta-N-acetylhexosaminidase
MHPVIVGLAGLSLTTAEEALFKAHPPAGYILFSRNIQNPVQVSTLTERLRALHGGLRLPILIDQEGGRVQRMSAPHWPVFPSFGHYGKRWAIDHQTALQQCYRDQFRLAQKLADAGVTVNCTPVLDVPADGADPIIGDRAFSTDLAAIIALGNTVLKAHHDAGVATVIKHLPGHGRAPADSHKMLPVVEASRSALYDTDIRPFHALRHAPWAMTAHILYRALDEAQPATTSPFILQTVIRQHIGFKGILVSDDLGMNALRGTLPERAHAALTAGCDLALHCSGILEETASLLEAGLQGSPNLAQRLVASLEKGMVSWV